MTENFSNINDNFDTIKTMLNSIRAQGVLNTTDVDKLLSGINSKLEKINTEEDINLIKAFLTELKQNLDERHNVLVSKFGAIESLFTNLLKNSSETMKSSELKELFDIVATNLSVFSREVVSQKESLSDLSLRLDAMRSDDSQKTEIIKNISVLKNDLDRFNNGFDSIILNINENFKTLVKSISDLDRNDEISGFAEDMSKIKDISNAILSAIDLFDKKNNQLDSIVSTLATQEDINGAKRTILELSAQTQNLSTSIDSITEKSYKLDNLADKIDASVNIIAGLKSLITDTESQTESTIKARIDDVENSIKSAITENNIESIKLSLESLCRDILGSANDILSNQRANKDIINSISENINRLNLDVTLGDFYRAFDSSKENIKESIVDQASKVIQVLDSNINSTIDSINSNAELLNSQIADTQTTITELCQKSFSDVIESVAALKSAVSMIDESNLSANNAMFANITDRLSLFENSLNVALEKHSGSYADSNLNISEQIVSLKKLADTLDYKMDSSYVEMTNSKIELESLKNSVDNLVGMDFIKVINDLKEYLGGNENKLENYIESHTDGVTNKLSKDIFGKYELLVSKLDSVEDNFKNIQAGALAEIRPILNKLSNSLMDVISYVSEKEETNPAKIDERLVELSRNIKDTSINYVEDVRNIVDVINLQVQNNLKLIEGKLSNDVTSINSSITDSTSAIRTDIKNSYDKLVDVQSNFDEIKEILNLNSINQSNSLSNVIDTAESLKNDFELKLSTLRTNLLDKVAEFKNEFSCENADKISELKMNSENLHSKAIQNSVDIKNEIKTKLDSTVDTMLSNFEELIKSVNSSVESIQINNEGVVDYLKNDFINSVDNKTDSVKSEIENTLSKVNEHVSDVVNNINQLDSTVGNLSKDTTEALSQTLVKISDNFVSLKALINNSDEKSAASLKQTVETMKEEFYHLKDEFNIADKNIDEDLARQVNIIEGNFDSLNSLVTDLMADTRDALGQKLDSALNDMSAVLNNSLNTQLEDYKLKIETVFQEYRAHSSEQDEFFKTKLVDLNTILNNTLRTQNESAQLQLNDISDKLKDILEENIKYTKSDYDVLRNKIQEFADIIESNNVNLVASIKTQVDDIAKYIDTGLETQANEVNKIFSEINSGMQNIVSLTRESNDGLKQAIEVNSSEIKDTYLNVLMPGFKGLETKLAEYFSSKSLEILNVVNDSTTQLTGELLNKGSALSDEIKTVNLDIKTAFENLNSRLDQDDINQMNVYQTQINELSKKFNDLISDAKNVTKQEVSAISESLIQNSKTIMDEVDQSIEDKINSLLATNANISAGELQAMEGFATKILDNIEGMKKNSLYCQDVITNLINERLTTLSGDIEKETDVIVGDILEQAKNIQDSAKDNLSAMTDKLESVVNGYITDAVYDLKEYFDIKTDSTVVNSKLDFLNTELEKIEKNTLNGINQLLQADAFSETVSNINKTNEILITSMADNLNNQIKAYIKEDVSDKFTDKLNLFDKKFIDTLTDKYAELQLLSSENSKALKLLSNNIGTILDDVNNLKDSVSSDISSQMSKFNRSLDDLKNEFVQLKQQLIEGNDEKLQSFISNQINDVEKLVVQQMNYINDISELCCDNLPEITEINALIKYNIKKSLTDIAEQISEQDEKYDTALERLKTDIITQFINVFNQISFVTEQEEILSFIQEKHSDLVTILSHLVTTSGDISDVRENLSSVDSKIESLKNDISVINQKVTSILSSNGDIDYVYSMQDLESDIANLRIVLNDIGTHKNEEYSELLKSTNEMYKLVETIKSQVFDDLSDDIVSISSRTNKLLLASDESYKALQDNLHDFRLVINDLDERTKNFSKEAGIDKIDNKLSAINTMIKNGAKTNQIFNQVFEYLAEWVDSAGSQIASISDKVESLDDIGQIKVMLEDLKAGSGDTTESKELVEALSNVFEKQAKRISSLESKLDRIIVDNTINSRNNKLDISPLEDTLNRFLVAIDEKMISQETRVKAMESKLEEFVTVVDNNNTTQLTKKVGGMDRQIAKLNKSIEKIASHVIEK